MYAVIRTGGKQYRVSENDVLRVEKLPTEVGGSLDFDVLAVGEGSELKIGRPMVEGAKVTGTVIRHARGRKVIVFKYKKRKKLRRKNGHRQHFTEIRITGIAG